MQKEKWYGTEFTSEQFSDSFLKSIKNPVYEADIDIPKQNKFIPSNTDLKQVDPIQSPVEIKKGIWFKSNEKFKDPKGEIKLKIYKNKE